ncbi:NRDE family protein [Halorhabdus rudnickae]|uniref:NRDE family protein n=1 Tax=Halorhabdus rudnickae TaxID=1775544 RepID=UPI001082B2F1|nr:NRDE family protein [Halorhabdus rudnickae]
MCTLVFAWRVFDEMPVAVAANRDEVTDRPSEAPSVWDTDPAILAPRDSSAGGTWIGYNEYGVCAAITNRWLDEPPAADRSRGLLVRGALGSETAEDAARLVERAVEADSYDGFNLVVADENAAIYLEWDGSLTVRNVDPSVHVVVNVGADGRYRIPAFRAEAGRQQAENADTLRTALQPEPGESGDAWLDRAGEFIADHEYGVCIHGDGFGTRSSSLLALSEDDREYWYADGPPCETEYERLEGQV